MEGGEKAGICSIVRTGMLVRRQEAGMQCGQTWKWKDRKQGIKEDRYRNEHGGIRDLERTCMLVQGQEAGMQRGQTWKWKNRNPGWKVDGGNEEMWKGGVPVGLGA